MAVSKFWKSKCLTNLKCFGCLIGMKNGECGLKNVVYELECKLCKDKYIGQTARCVSKRMEEHYRDAKNGRGNMGTHLLMKHGSNKAEDFKGRVIWRGSNSVVMSAESVFIKELKPNINIMLNLK